MPPLPFLLLVPFAVLAWVRPRAAVLLLLALLPTYLWRWSVAGVPTTWLELALYLAAVLYTVRSTASPWRSLLAWQNIRWLAPAVAWLLAACLGAALAEDKRIALGILKGWVFDPMLLCALVAVAASEASNIKRYWQEAIFMLLVGTTGTTIAAITYTALVGQGGRLAAWYDSPNVLAMYLAPIAVAGLAWYAGEGRGLLQPGWKQVWLTLCATTVLGTILSGSYAGFTSLVLSLVVYWLLRRTKNQKISGTVLTVLIAVGLALPWLSATRGEFPLPTRVNPASGITSGEIRVILWREATRLVRDHPLGGIGLGQWQPHVAPLITPKLAGVHNPTYLVELYYASLFPHSLWLTTWLSLGLLGVLSLCGLTWVVHTTVRESALPMAVLSVILIHGMVDTPVFKNDLAVLLWLTLLAAAGARTLRSEPAPSYAHRTPAAA